MGRQILKRIPRTASTPAAPTAMATDNKLLRASVVPNEEGYLRVRKQQSQLGSDVEGELQTRPSSNYAASPTSLPFPRTNASKFFGIMMPQLPRSTASLPSNLPSAVRLFPGRVVPSKFRSTQHLAGAPVSCPRRLPSRPLRAPAAQGQPASALPPSPPSRYDCSVHPRGWRCKPSSKPPGRHQHLPSRRPWRRTTTAPTTTTRSAPAFPRRDQRRPILFISPLRQAQVDDA